MINILTVCPTRCRPQRAKEMLESFTETVTENNILLFCVDDDDPQLEEYAKLISMGNCYVIVKPRMNVTKIINEAFQIYPDLGFYHVTNDDFVYKTKGWDTTFVNKINEIGYGICYGNDLLQMERMPTAPFISGNIVRTLGWLQMPLLTHLGGDCAWMEIGKKLNCLHYFPNIIIEHKHYQARKASVDSIYEQTNSAKMYESDRKAFFKWGQVKFHEEIQRLRMVLSNQ